MKQKNRLYSRQCIQGARLYCCYGLLWSGTAAGRVYHWGLTRQYSFNALNAEQRYKATGGTGGITPMEMLI